MLEVKNIKVYNLKESIVSCRNAMRVDMPEYSDEEFQKGLERAKKLVRAGGGSGETSFRKGILVSFDLKYSQYITKQFQRYHWFEYVSSSSMMHRIVKMNFDECCNKYVTEESKALMKRLIDEYNHIEGQEEKYTAFMKVISNCPMGTELFVHITTNYEQLATIYKQRKHHKLKEDWGAFCKTVEELPYFKELIAYEDNL